MTTLIDQLTVEFGQPSHATSRPGDDSNGAAAKQFKIDDEGADDHYPGFCRIWIVSPNADGNTFTLRLDNAPHNSDVSVHVRSLGGEIVAGPMGATISIPLHTDNAKFVRELAKAIRRVTARGQRYADKNWKWISRRTADALERFASVLAAANRSSCRRKGPHRPPSLNGT